MRILVIGGTGIISHYVTEKYRDMGHTVTAINRGNRKYLNVGNVEYIVGDGNNKKSLMEVMGNRFFDKIIDFTTFDKETMRMKMEVLSGKCRHYIFISSVAVYERSAGAECYMEDMPIGNSKWPYGLRKSECEKVLCESGNKDFNYTIIRPGITCGEMFVPYSPIDTYGMPGYLTYCILTGKEILTTNIGEDEIQVMHAADMAENIYSLLCTNECVNESFNLSGDEYITANQILQKLADALGMDAVACYVPQNEFVQNTMMGPLVEGGWHDRYSNEKVKGVLGSKYLTSRSVLNSLDESIEFHLKHCEYVGWPKVSEEGIQYVIKNAKLNGQANLKYVKSCNALKRGKTSLHDSYEAIFRYRNWLSREEHMNISFDNERNKKKFDLMCQWMRLKLQGISLMEFFQDRGLQSIAIYGMGEIGQLIYDELTMENEALIRYAIDKSGKRYVESLPVYCLDRGLPKVDAIVITPVLITDQLEEQIYDMLGECVTFVFEELLYELSRKHGIASTLWGKL